MACGRNPLDFWQAPLELGFPQFFYYQNFPHLFVVGLATVVLGAVDDFTLFNLVRFVLLVGLPVTVFWSMRRMGFSFIAAGVAAAVASLLSGDGRYGFEYDSYIWRGFGMFTQLWAMHLSFITLACVYRVLQRGSGYLPAVLAFSMLALSHLIYAYMMVITLVLALLLVGGLRTILPRVARLAIVGGSVRWRPLLHVAALPEAPEYLAASPYLQPWKYDSFGAETILGWLFSGDLLDHGRLPVLSGLLAVGALASILRPNRLRAFACPRFPGVARPLLRPANARLHRRPVPASRRAAVPPLHRRDGSLRDHPDGCWGRSHLAAGRSLVEVEGTRACVGRARGWDR